VSDMKSKVRVIGVNTPLPPGAILVGDDAIFVVGRDGELSLVCAPRHPHPTGLSREPVATGRRQA
jgi:hypothetical protein